MDRVFDLLQKVSCKIVIGISMLIVGFLLVQAVVTDVRINVDEKTTFEYFSDWWKYCIVIFLFVYIIAVIDKYCKWMFDSRFIKIITFFFAIAMLCFIMFTQMEPRADQQMVLQVADQFAKGNYSAWNKGSYGDLYANQYGLILVLAVFTKIWGNYNWMAFQIMNIFFVIAAALGMKKITFLLFNNEKISKIVYLILLFYLPMNLYVTFVYGTLPGLTFVVWGTYFILKAFEKDSIMTGIWGAAFIVLACILKNNYLIYFLGTLIIVFFYLCRKKTKTGFCLMLGLLILYVASGNLINHYINGKVGNRADRGIPSIAWVAMGLQENEKKGPGWYNGYTKDMYWNNDCDSSRTKLVAKKDIEKSIKYLASDKRAGIKFFYKKIASEWNEPTFESLWINNKFRNRAEDIPPHVQDFFDEQNAANEIYIITYKSFLILLWMGIILFLYSERKNGEIINFLWMIVFIGGFLFHLFWEAKGQYALIYVWLCIPYGVKGYYSLFNSIKNKRKNYK